MAAVHYLTVSVPSPVYPQVIDIVQRYLGRQVAEAAGETYSVPADDEVVYVPNQGDWTKEMLRTVKESCPYDAAFTAIDATARNANRMTFYDEIVKTSKIPPRIFQARLGAFSKFTKKNFGEKTWPFEWGYVGDRLFYRMPLQLADWWHEL